MKVRIDWGLKFYREIFGLEMLHFGYWDNLKDEKDINIENLKIAQRRYVEHLIEIIPEKVKTILDVGAGTGEVAKMLSESGFYIECVLADKYQYEIFKSKLPDKVSYLCKFEDLNINNKYDLILMAESCQYLDLHKAFCICNDLLSQDGYILVADYFRKTENKYYKTVPVEQKFISLVSQYGFNIEYEEDITEKVLPTLTLGMQIYNKYAIPVIEIITGYFTSEHPLITKLIKFLFYLQIKKVRKYLYFHMKDKLDQKKFFNFVVYKIFLLKKC